jgi:hypothetical protein
MTWLAGGCRLDRYKLSLDIELKRLILASKKHCIQQVGAAEKASDKADTGWRYSVSAASH